MAKVFGNDPLPAVSAWGVVVIALLALTAGTLVLKSTVAGHVNVDLAPLVIHEISVVGSRCGPFRPALDALTENALDVRSLVSDQVPLADALRRAAEPGTLKVLVAPGFAG